MATATTKIKNGIISLPKEFKKAWKEAEIFITGEKDIILIKRVKASSFSQMLNEFRKIGKKIKKKDVEEAVNWARRKVSK